VGVTRIIPDLPVSDVAAANALYAELFGLDIGMDRGWVGAVLAPQAPSIQLNVMTEDASAPVNPAVSVGLSTTNEVDAVLERVRAAGLEVVHPPTHEAWGVYRFFFRDPDGNVVNVVAHIGS
jgi:predicted enzyme related to lactoylglutathione lyase